MLIPGRKVSPRNVMQTNLELSWGFSSKNHVQTAREFHDSSMDLVWTRLSFIRQGLQTTMHIGINARMIVSSLTVGEIDGPLVRFYLKSASAVWDYNLS